MMRQAKKNNRSMKKKHQFAWTYVGFFLLHRMLIDFCRESFSESWSKLSWGVHQGGSSRQTPTGGVFFSIFFPVLSFSCNICVIGILALCNIAQSVQGEIP
jgi:hypothetical protein